MLYLPRFFFSNPLVFPRKSCALSWPNIYEAPWNLVHTEVYVRLGIYIRLGINAKINLLHAVHAQRRHAIHRLFLVLTVPRKRQV